jgi:CDP-glucose 4,6-dehydratase
MTDSKFWLDRRVLVTGCTGMLGAWLTQALVGLGADVVGVVRDWVPHSHLVRSGAIDRIKVIRADVTDADAMVRAFSDYEIDTCFHLAAQTTVGIANRSPVPTLEANVRGTWCVLEAARQWPGLSRLLIASSDKAYGSHASLPYTEEAALLGEHPYDVSKSCADLIARAYAKTFGLPVAVTRCGNMYGGGDLNWNRVVPGTVRSVLRGQRPIIRSDGTMRRDYVFVLDIADAYLTLAEAMERGQHRGEAFNFGLDAPRSVMEVVQTIIVQSGRTDLEPIVLGQAPNEIQDQYLSSEKAHRLLGWQPKHSLEEGLRQTIGWYREYLSD